jgi:hypothetical protein
LRNAVAVCALIPGIYTAFGDRLKGGDLPFTYGIVPVAGAPYSAVGVTDSATTFVDGNRITRHETTRFYRDGRGRTRIEHTSPPAMAAIPLQMPATVLINDPVAGECYVLETPKKIAHVLSHPNDRGVTQPPIALGIPSARLVMPGFDIASGAGFALAATYSSPEPGTQVSLGEKTIDGITVVGTRLNHRVRAGDFGNEQPISVTVEYWFSPDLGVALRDTQHTTIGGEINYRLEQIVQAEPDAALFKVPPEYTRNLETVRLQSQAVLSIPNVEARPAPRPTQPPVAPPILLIPP